MKKSLVALAVLASTGTAFAAGHAAAPASSVTLFGILDAGVTNVDKNTSGASFTGLTSSNVASSQFGMRGSENIGGGLRAIFELAADVDTNNGAFDSTPAGYNNGTLFRRGSWAGLAGGFGQITFGRRLNPMIVGAAGDQVLSSNSTATARAAAMNYADFWTKNAVTYVSPTMSGLTVHAQYGFDNVAGAGDNGSMYSLTAIYSQGALSATGGYHKVAGGIAATDNVVAAPGVEKEVTFVTGKYAMGPFTIGAGFHQTKAAGSAKREATTINLGYNFSKQLLSSISYGDYEGTKVATLQGRYVLSARTSLYGLFNSIDNGTVTTFFPIWGARALAGGRAGKQQNALTVGVIHAF
jgi:predicted porin